METTANNTTGNLTTELHSSAFVLMESTKGKQPATGNRYCKLIKKGENSKLGHSVAVEIPALNNYPDCGKYDAISIYLVSAMESLQDAYIKGRAVAGAKVIQYSELSIANLEVFAAQMNEVSGIGQLSEERIKGWFEADMREMLIVALADRLGISDTASDADVKRLEQIANQTRDNLAKLSSKKPVYFDERVSKALNWALDSAASADDTMATRLRDKLNQKVEDMNLGDALGF